MRHVKTKQSFSFLSFLHNSQFLDFKKDFIRLSAIFQEDSGEFVLWQGYLNKFLEFLSEITLKLTSGPFFS